jgi:hypothetical protein
MARLEKRQANPTRLKVCQGTTRPASQTNGPSGPNRAILCLVLFWFLVSAAKPCAAYVGRPGKGLSPDSSSDRICSADLLSSLFVPRLLPSPLIAHDALIGSIAPPRLTPCCTPWLRLRHALLAAMLATLILHTFQVVFTGHRNTPCFHSVFPTSRPKIFRVCPMSDNAMQSRAFPRSPGRGPKPAGTQIRATSFDSRITYPKQEDSHAIQACYFGPRGRLVVRGDGDRVGADAAGSGSFERRQRRTGRYRQRQPHEISYQFYIRVS